MQEFQLENLIRNNIFQFCKPFVAKQYLCINDRIEDALNEILQIKQVISDIKVKCEGTDDNIAQLEHLMYYIMFIRNQKDIIVENIGQKCIKIEDYCTSTISKNLSDILSLKLDFQNVQLEQTDQNEYIGALQNLSRGMTERIEMQNNSTLKMINKLQSDTQEFRLQQQQENEQVHQQINKNNYEIFQQQQSINQVLQLSEQIIEFKHQVDSKIGWIEGSQKEIVSSYQQFMTRTEFQYEVNQLENTIKLLQKQVKQIESEQDTQQSQPQIKIHNLSPATPMFQQITQLNNSDITQKELDKITQEIDKKILNLRNELTFIINQDQKKLDSDIKQMSKQIELIQLKIKDQTQYCRTGFEKSKTNSSELQSFKNSYQQQMNALKQDIQNALEQQLLQQVENQIQKSLSSTMKGSFSVPTTSKLLQDQTKSEEPLMECNYLEQQIIQSDVLIKYIKGICSEVKTNQPQTTDFEIQDSDSSQKVDNIKHQIQNKSTNDKDMYKMHAEIVKIKSDIQNHQEYFQSQIKQLFKYKSLQDDTIQRLSKKTLYQQEQLNVSLAILLQNEMSLYQYVNILQIQPPSKLKNQELGFELDFDPNLQDDIIFGGNKLGKIEVIHRVLKLSSTNKLKKQQQKDDNEELKKQTTFKPYENQYNQLQQLQPPQRSRKKMSFQNPPKQKRNNFSIDLQQMPNQDTDKVPPSLQDKIDQVNQSLDFSYRKLPYSTRQQVLIKYKKLN